MCCSSSPEGWAEHTKVSTCLVLGTGMLRSLVQSECSSSQVQGLQIPDLCRRTRLQVSQCATRRPRSEHQERLQMASSGGMLLWDSAMGTKVLKTTQDSVTLPSRKLKRFYASSAIKSYKV